ncbi:MAG: phosphopantetheine-binding protein [Flavobacteriales bacterium]
MPSAPQPILRADFVAPRDDREKRLSDLWSEVLKVDKIGVRDNFFDTGGHSLLGIQLLARVEEEFGGSMALKEPVSSAHGGRNGSTPR